MRTELATLIFMLLGQIDTVKLSDGSIVSGTVQAKHVNLDTGYGKLAIPVADILHVSFGNRPTEANRIKIDRLIRDLGNPSFKVRDDASRELGHMGQLPLPQLALVDDLEAERKSRAVKLLAKIKLLHPDSVNGDDEVETVKFAVRGIILEDELVVNTKLLGKLTIPRDGLLSLARTVDETVVVKAGDWVKTGIRVRGKLTIESEGQVDLWPQGPGQYVVDPEGYNTNGLRSSFKGGALIGKVGDGPEFMVGKRHHGTHGSGLLWLRVVPSPWNNESSGHHTAKVKTR